MAEVLNDINNDTRTVIGLRHLDEIKAYVDGRIGEVSGEVTEEINEYLQKQLNDAKDKIEKDTENKLKDLKDKLDQAILEGDESAIRDLQLKIDVLTEDLNTKFEALDAINDELDRINGKYGDLSNSIFTPGEIDELIKTAFIDGTYITNDSVTTPNVFTTKLVALIAKFGKIKAANIEAGAITGHTISCDNLDKNGNPMWSLNEDGSGNIAGDNITWDKNGKVELGEDVTLSWKSVDNTGNPALDKLNKLENAQNDLKDIVNNGFQNIVSGWIEDGVLNPTEIKAIKSELEKITSNYELLNRYLDEIIDIYATAKTSDIDKEVKTKYYEDLKVAKKKLSDAYVNAKSVCEYYINANGNSIGTIKLNDTYDLKKINKYYEVQNEVTLFYQEANSFYVTDNRFGSKLTYIGEDGIYSGNISGDQITGWRLRGLTMESGHRTGLPSYVNWQDYNKDATVEEDAFISKTGGNGPTWQIDKMGNGHLAAGQISWEGKNVTLGPEVRINWKQVDEVPEGLEDLKAEVDENLKELFRRLGISEKDIAEFKGSQIAVESNLKNINTSIAILNETLNRIESGESAGDSGGGSTSVLSKEDVENIAFALTQEPVYASNVWAGIITAAAMRSEKIYGTEIRGIGVSSYDDVTLTDGKSGPAWKLQNNGSGYLAKGNITWTKEGKVTLGAGVTINWESINNRPSVDDNGNISLDEVKIKEIVDTTKLGAYEISSGTIAANLVQSRKNDVLVNGTTFYTIDSDTGEMQSQTTAGNNDNGPIWQIAHDGTGYFASGNIRWDKNGELHANINGEFSGGNNGNVGTPGGDSNDYPMTWNDETINFNRNVVFGKDCTISWQNGEPGSGGSSDISEDSLRKKLTSIGRDWITTKLIDASKIDAKALTVGALDTRDNGGTLHIDGNNIEVYDKNSNNIILNITGDEIADISAPSSGSTQNVSISYTYTNKIYNDFDANLYDLFTNTDKSVAKYDADQQFYYLEVGNFTIPNNGYSYKFGNSTATANLSLSFRTENTSMLDANIGEIELYYDFVILKNGEIFNKMDNCSYINIKFSGGNFSTSYSQRFLFYGQAITNNTYISSGDYKIYFRYKFNEMNFSNENLKLCKLNTDGFYASINNIFTISGSSIEQSKFNIGSNGFNYSISNDRYIQFTEDKNFIITNGGNTIMLDDTGNIWMGFNNDNEIDKDLNNPTEAKKLNVYKVVPRTYKFRLQGDRNQWMTVLTLGETKEVQ